VIFARGQKEKELMPVNTLRALLLPLAALSLQACGSDASTPEQAQAGGGSAAASDGAQARFDATLAYAKDSIEKKGGRILSAYLAEGTGTDGETTQFLCGLSIEKGKARAFSTEAAVEAERRALFGTNAGGRAEHPTWQKQCMKPALGPDGQEISMRAESDVPAGAVPNADAVDAAIDAVVE
jgi:hypothetical protein